MVLRAASLMYDWFDYNERPTIEVESTCRYPVGFLYDYRPAEPGPLVSLFRWIMRVCR